MGSFSRMLENEKSGGLKWALDAFHANIPALAGSFFVVGSNRPSEQQHDS